MTRKTYSIIISLNRFIKDFYCLTFGSVYCYWLFLTIIGLLYRRVARKGEPREEYVLSLELMDAIYK